MHVCKTAIFTSMQLLRWLPNLSADIISDNDLQAFAYKDILQLHMNAVNRRSPHLHTLACLAKVNRYVCGRKVVAGEC